MDKEQLLKNLKGAALKHFDLKGFASELMHEVVDPALDELVAKTDNNYDDMLKAGFGQ